jgi:hypothetical protein
MAWGCDGRGLTINLAEVPDDVLSQMIGWYNDKIEDENAKHGKK